MGSNRREYDVGYGKPPAHTQFKKGQSGNPKGRPKGALNVATALNRALKERVTIVENGRRKKITKLEAAIKGLVNRAVTGDAGAMRQLMGLAHLVGVEPAADQTPQLGSDDAHVLAGLLQRFAAADQAGGLDGEAA